MADKAPKPRGPRLYPGDMWFVIPPKSITVYPALIDEVTPGTVVLRFQPELGREVDQKPWRLARTDVRFIHKVPS